MSAFAALLLPLLALQDEPRSFPKDQRLTAAYYQLLPGARHAAEFLDMGKAGVDIALVGFSGAPESLDPLISALDGLEKDSKPRPRLGVLLQPGPEPDLSSADAFFDRIPPRHAAFIDGRPVVWLAPAPAGAKPPEAALRRLKHPPYLVAELSWKSASADRVYAQGGIRGFAMDLPVVSVGPGTISRDDGKVYERIWYKALRLEPRMVVIESWNGTSDGVSETADRKRKYVDLTARCIRDFKVNEKIVLPKGKWSSANQVAWTIVYTPHDQGLHPMAVEDGLYDEIRLRGFEALGTKENKKGSIRRLCFDVDDSFSFFDRKSYDVAVEFLDLGEGSFTLEYDSADQTLPAEKRVVKPAGVVRFTGSGEWRTEVLSLPDAAFGNGQPGGSDFRLTIDQRGLSVRAVMVMRK